MLTSNIAKTLTQNEGENVIFSRCQIGHPGQEWVGAYTSKSITNYWFPFLKPACYRDKWWVIDIGGHNLRMIAFIEFRDNRMYVKHVVSHAEHDKLTDKYRQTKES
ncbi:type II toxin-antitoxin system HigB family toxin [Nitrincola lacisaponensis]|uniref:type II toxin-antitoxin system HigB family toxin n=1 Tax=Nitrincola lacisaponensis TaxID=267850 RepID=UPI000A0595DA|nr:type II toxin-antitoxin system HigB family toxin [Nitrincola lacisaponensis]